jgi:hypothetical protein
MLSDPIVLKDSAAADVTFSLLTNVTDQKSGQTTTVRTDISRGPTEPRTLTIKTNVTGSGANRVRRTSWLLSDTQLSVAGIPSTMTYQGSWVYPLNGEFATSNLDDSICLGSDLVLTTASLAVDTTKRAALLQGQA